MSDPATGRTSAFTRSRRILLGAVLAAAVLGTPCYWLFFRSRTTWQSSSISPDGMYTCDVLETDVGGSQVYTLMTIRARGENPQQWNTLCERPLVSNDSATRPYYSIVWQYDTNYTTLGVEVFAPYGGSPPYKPDKWVFPKDEWDAKASKR